MIPYNIITSFLTTVFMLFFGQSMLQTWNNIDQTEKNEHLWNIQFFFRSAGKKLNKDKGKRRMKEPDNYEGNPETVNAWYKHMTMYFQSNNISSNWEWIEIALGKIKKEKDNHAQWWVNKNITKFVPFQKEWRELEIADNKEVKLRNMTHKSPFNSWNNITQAMEIFFISTKT